MEGACMTRILLAFDQARAEDESVTWRRIAMGLRDSGIQQVHLRAARHEGPAPAALLEDTAVLTCPMPLPWWRTRTLGDRLARQIESHSVDALVASGEGAVSALVPVRDRLDIPLLVDVWRGSQLDQFDAIRADLWIARSEALAEALRKRVEHGTVVTARAPIVQTPATRLPDKRPSLVVLDPGDRPRLWDALLDALTTVLEARPDLECIMELRNRREHRLWRQLRQRELLSRISVESTAGPLESLVAAATMVVAPDPSMPCRTIISTAMAGGAVLLAASAKNDELIRDRDTAVVVDQGTATQWTEAMQMVLEDPQKRHDWSRHAIAAVSAACEPESTLAAWVTAVASATAPSSYAIGST